MQVKLSHMIVAVVVTALLVGFAGVRAGMLLVEIETLRTECKQLEEELEECREASKWHQGSGAPIGAGKGAARP